MSKNTNIYKRDGVLLNIFWLNTLSGFKWINLGAWFQYNVERKQNGDDSFKSKAIQVSASIQRTTKGVSSDQFHRLLPCEKTQPSEVR